MSKKIPLQNGLYAIVDKEDYEKASKYTWTLSHTNNSNEITSSRLGVSLDRFILNVDNGGYVIRKNKNVLDNRKSNLLFTRKRKIVSHATRGRRNTSSKYKGVTWDKKNNKWLTGITIDGKRKHLGRFSDEDEAAKAYNVAALKYYGEHAYQNIIGTDNSADFIEIKKRKTKRTKNKTGYRGVYKNGNKYSSTAISKTNKSIYLGTFNTPEQAAKAYDKKSYELHGDNAILNFPELIEEYKREIKNA